MSDNLSFMIPCDFDDGKDVTKERFRSEHLFFILSENPVDHEETNPDDIILSDIQREKRSEGETIVGFDHVIIESHGDKSDAESVCVVHEVEEVYGRGQGQIECSWSVVSVGVFELINFGDENQENVGEYQGIYCPHSGQVTSKYLRKYILDVIESRRSGDFGIPCFEVSRIVGRKLSVVELLIHVGLLDVGVDQVEDDNVGDVNDEEQL